MGAGELYKGKSGQQYFEQRSNSRAEGAQRARAKHFSGFTSSSDVVLDFGCGTGGLVSNLPAARRIGVEISELAAAQASTKLDLVVDSLARIETGSVDKVLSYHALEHVDNPFEVVKEIRRVLAPSGSVRIMVPCDVPFLAKTHGRWSDNPDFHLNSWTPMTLGNLLTVAGFKVTQSAILPDSNGGRLAALFGEGSSPRRFFIFAKAFRSGRFHTSVTAVS